MASKPRIILYTDARAAVMIIGALALTYIPYVILPTLAVWFSFISGIAAFFLAAWLSFSIFNSMRVSVHAWMWLFAAAGLLVGVGGFIGEINADLLGTALRLQVAGIFLLLCLFIFAGRLLIGLHGSWREVSLMLIALGLIIWIVSLLALSEIRTLAGLLVLAGAIHWGMRPATQIKPGEQEVTGSTLEKMARALREITVVILSEFALDFGNYTSVAVEKGSYQASKKNGGDAQFNNTPAGTTPADYGTVMALSLEQLLGSVARVAGKKYAWRVLAHGYDRLNWELQEILEDHALKYVSYASGLSNALAVTRDDLNALIRSVPIFIALTEAEIVALGKQFKSHGYARGEDIIRVGGMGNTFYIIRAGQVEVLSGGGDTLNTLQRGDYFGEVSLLTNQKRNATIRAHTPVEVLALKKSSFDKLIRDNVIFDETARAEFKLLGMLRQIPLFSQFEGLELRLLVREVAREQIQTGDVIFKQGDQGDSFYVIESGKVSVQIDAHERATLGEGEYFGEIALMMNTPRTATVVALQPTTLLCLQADDFTELLRDSSAMKQAIERASSRRMLSDERWLRLDSNQHVEIP